METNLALPCVSFAPLAITTIKLVRNLATLVNLANTLKKASQIAYPACLARLVIFASTHVGRENSAQVVQVNVNHVRKARTHPKQKLLRVHFAPKADSEIQQRHRIYKPATFVPRIPSVVQRALMRHVIPVRLE